ncbi:MAG: C25 family cysteine peptidase [Pirellulales bacterium]
MKLSVMLLAVVCCAAAVATAAPDTLVVCPAEFRSALAPWEEFRRGQGHELQVVDVPLNAADLQATIRRAAAAGRLEYLVLVGDAAADESQRSASQRLYVATNSVPAKINVRWGSAPTIATDVPYADVDGDGAPDVAVGRIPADSAEELSAVVRKIIRYETRTEREPWDRRLAAVTGTGGFGPIADAMIEAAGQQIMSQALPAGYLVALTRAKTGSPALRSFAARGPAPSSPRTNPPIGHKMGDGCLMWVYLGHGWPTALDYVAGPAGPESILSVRDVGGLQCGGRCPLAVLVACHTGAFDASRDCLAEKLLMAEEGPVAVLAATRVSMPYGNTIFGYEFLRASLADRPATLGAAFRLAQQRTLAAGGDDAMRKSLDAMAGALCPLLERGGPPWRPEDLVTERREHVAMYQLLGDPLMRWRRPRPMQITALAEIDAGRVLMVDGQCELAGDCVVELARIGGVPNGGSDVIESATSPAVGGEKFRIAVNVPADASGRYTVRAYLQGDGGTALGGTNIFVRPRAE